MNSKFYSWYISLLYTTSSVEYWENGKRRKEKLLVKKCVVLIFRMTISWQQILSHFLCYKYMYLVIISKALWNLIMILLSVRYLMSVRDLEVFACSIKLDILSGVSFCQSGLISLHLITQNINKRNWIVFLRISILSKQKTALKR